MDTTMAEARQHDLIVIGAGPGGYVAAIRAAQLGLNTACIEQEAALGGTCLRIGCIPSKCLLEDSDLYVEARQHFAEHGIRVGEVHLDLPAMLKRKDRVVQTLAKGIEALFRKNNVTRYTGRGRIDGPGKVVLESKDGAVELQSKHVLIATGSKAAVLPGFHVDGQHVITSTEALAMRDVPTRLVVIGAGYIGMEMASIWSRLGSQVTVLECFNRILMGLDEEIAGEAQRLFARQGMDIRLGARVSGVRIEGEGCIVDLEGAESIRCDRVLMAVGRQPNTQDLGLDTVGIALDKKGRIEVDDHFSTSIPGIYAIGDVIRGPMLAHKAEEEGIACVERIVTGYGHVDYDVIPGVVYTNPEIAGVGKTENQLQQAGVKYNKGVFPFRANARARTQGQVEGKVKVLADAETDRILGVHIMGPRAGDLIAEAAAAMAFGATSEDLARVCHAHPTLPEALKEAAMAVSGRTIHF
jgi:dihydrolipoamide dehydrogenase